MRSRPRNGRACFVLSCSVLALASTLVCVVFALDVPTLTGRVVDLAHVMPADAAAALSREIEAHEAETGNQVAVLLVPSLDGEPLEEFSHRVAVRWKLGQKGTDNGVLLLIAIAERKIRIEVGYGLEGTLTDARSAQIIRNEIVPRFRAGDYPGGVKAGTEAILNTIGAGSAAPKNAAAPADTSISRLAIAVLAGVVVGLVFASINRMIGSLVGGGLSMWLAPWVLPALGAAVITLVFVAVLGGAFRGHADGRRRRRQAVDEGFWYSSGSGTFGGGSFGGGGGFSGGGGDFGGGGASGDWK